MESFGQRLKKLRLKAGLRQKQVAERAGISASTCRDWESTRVKQKRGRVMKRKCFRGLIILIATVVSSSAFAQSSEDFIGRYKSVSNLGGPIWDIEYTAGWYEPIDKCQFVKINQP